MREQERIDGVRAALPAWFEQNRRDLPWRRTRDPYAIWVSEIMLQQTQVDTAIPYFERFMARFPDVRTLAEAPIDAVLKAWEGLGYYARARNLHAAAKRVAAEFGGSLPADAGRLRMLPGIGRYTAGAIASIAFNLDAPILDGNVTRVLCRLFRIRRNPKDSAVQKRLWRLAERLIPSGRAGVFNQAMMELGATVCTPTAPHCPECPVTGVCAARQRGEETRLPAKARRRPTPHYDIAAGIVWKRNRILIDQRRPDGLLGGLWEFPGGKACDGETLRECVEREVREELGVRARAGELLVTVEHAYSHFRITLHTFECQYVSGRPRAIGCVDWRWVRLDELDQYAFPTANRKVIEALRRRGCEGMMNGGPRVR